MSSSEITSQSVSSPVADFVDDEGLVLTGEQACNDISASHESRPVLVAKPIIDMLCNVSCDCTGCTIGKENPTAFQLA